MLASRDERQHMVAMEINGVAASDSNKRMRWWWWWWW